MKQGCNFIKIRFLDFLEIQKEERNLTVFPLPIPRITDPEDTMQFNAAGLHYCLHTILGNKRKILHSPCGIAKLKFASIHMSLLYEIGRIFILKTLRKPLIFLGAIYIFYSLLTLSQVLFFPLLIALEELEFLFPFDFLSQTLLQQRVGP